MFKKTAMTTLLVSALAGCSSIPGMESATVDRNELNAQLNATCTELGTEFTPVSFAVDKVSKIMVSIQERQCAVLEDYRTLADKHADVAGFLAINGDKSDEELMVAMNEFDAGKPESKKIAPQVLAYQNASSAIFDKNVELAKEIAIQGAEIAIIAAENSQLLLIESGASVFDGWMSAASGDEAGENKEMPIVLAYRELKARSELALEANQLINLDKNTIEQLEKLDDIVAEQVKS